MASSSDRPYIQNAPVGVIDIGARTSYLDNIWLVSAGIALTAKGYFANENGDRAKTPEGELSPSFSGTINAAGGTPKNFAQIAGLTGTVIANYPDAVGVKVILSGNVHEDVQDSGSASSDFTTNYANYPKLIADPEYNAFGRAG